MMERGEGLKKLTLIEPLIAPEVPCGIVELIFTIRRVEKKVIKVTFMHRTLVTAWGEG